MKFWYICTLSRGAPCIAMRSMFSAMTGDAIPLPDPVFKEPSILVTCKDCMPKKHSDECRQRLCELVFLTRNDACPPCVGGYIKHCQEISPDEAYAAMALRLDITKEAAQKIVDESKTVHDMLEAGGPGGTL